MGRNARNDFSRRRPPAKRVGGGADASRRYHDRVARQYDHMYDDPYWRFHDEITWRSVKPHLPRDMSASCADLGCGTGKWGLRLLKSGFGTTFVDNSGAMVEQSRKAAEALGKSERGRFIQADVARMPEVDGGQFALVLAMGDVLSICNDARKACDEIARILAPGGVAVVSADNKLAFLDHIMKEGGIEEIEAFARDGATHWLTQDPAEQFTLHTFTPQQLRKLFEQAGLEVLELRGKTILPVREHPEALEMDMDRLLAVEASLARDPSTAARAGHLQITARRRADGAAGEARPAGS